MKDFIQRILDSEASWFIGLITAALALVVSLGLLTQDRADAWVGIAVAMLPVLLPLIQAAATRLKVYSKNTTQALANGATFQAPGTPVDIGKPPDASPPLPEGEG